MLYWGTACSILTKHFISIVKNSISEADSRWGSPFGHLDMSGEKPFSGRGRSQGTQSSLLPSARLIPSPHTATEKAAIAAALHAGTSEKSFTKTRIAIGTAAAAVAVAVPNLSLEAMVSSVSGPFVSKPETQPVQATHANTVLPTQVWTPAESVAGPVYAKVLSEKEEELSFTVRPDLSKFDRELPLAVLDVGSQKFDLAFAGIEAPSLLTATVSSGLSDDPVTLTQSRSSALATQTIAIEQITDLDLVVRATPENVSETQQSLAVSSSSTRTDAIASRSVEAAFAGAIDVSSAVRNSLPVAPNAQPETSRPQVEEVRRAIPAAVPPPQVSATAAAQAALVPKAKLDARVNGVLTGSVDFRQLDGTIAIRLRSVAHMMREQFSSAEFAEIMGGQSIDNFVPLAQLQAAGIPISYSPAYDEVEFGIDYQDAPNAKKVQIDQISVAPIGPELTAIEQIPR